MLQCSQYHPVSEQFSAFFPVFLPYFSKHAHYRVTRFTLFLVELHKAVRLFVGRLLNRLISPPPTAVPHRTGARPLCRCATSPRTAGSHPLQGRLIGYIFFAPLAKGGKAAQPQGGIARSAYAKNSARPQTGAVWRGTLLFFRHQALFAAHIRLQGLGHQHTAVCLQVVLQEGDEHSGGRHHRVVQGVG